MVSDAWVRAFMQKVGPSMTRPCKPANPGTWKARHADRPDLFDKTGAWLPGVDRMR